MTLSVLLALSKQTLGFIIFLCLFSLIIIFSLWVCREMDKQGVVPNYLKLVKKDDSVVKRDDSMEIEMKNRIKALEMELLDKELRLIEFEKEIRQLKEKDNLKS